MNFAILTFFGIAALSANFAFAESIKCTLFDPVSGEKKEASLSLPPRHPGKDDGLSMKTANFSADFDIYETGTASFSNGTPQRMYTVRHGEIMDLRSASPVELTRFQFIATLGFGEYEVETSANVPNRSLVSLICLMQNR